MARGAIELGVLDAGGWNGEGITIITRNAPILNNGDGDSSTNTANVMGNNILFDLTGPTAFCQSDEEELLPQEESDPLVQ